MDNYSGNLTILMGVMALLYVKKRYFSRDKCLVTEYHALQCIYFYKALAEIFVFIYYSLCLQYFGFTHFNYFIKMPVTTAADSILKYI